MATGEAGIVDVCGAGVVVTSAAAVVDGRGGVLVAVGVGDVCAGVALPISGKVIAGGVVVSGDKDVTGVEGVAVAPTVVGGALVCRTEVGVVACPSVVAAGEVVRDGDVVVGSNAGAAVVGAGVGA